MKAPWLPSSLWNRDAFRVAAVLVSSEKSARAFFVFFAYQTNQTAMFLPLRRFQVRTAKTAAASTLEATWMTETHNVPSSSAVKTCSAPTRRQLHQPQRSTRSEQQQLCQPQGTNNSKNGARNRAANAIAQTSAQDELAVDFFQKKKKTVKNNGPGGSADEC